MAVKGNVVTFGEIMMRLSAPGFKRIVQADTFDVTYGGGEANVSVSLAGFGLESCFVSAVPGNATGQAAVNYLRRFGVNTDFMLRRGNRMGIYFLETGASQRPSGVIYDRSGSSVSETGKGVFPWEDIFRDASWFHFTGITPALSDSAAAAALEACRTAREAGVTVSCDLNYRSKLWSPEKAGRVMNEFMPFVNVVIANEEDAEKIFGIGTESSDVEKGTLDEEGYRNVARRLVKQFNLKMAAVTLRESFSASDNGWSGLLYDGKEFYRSKRYMIRIVDRVGSGDSFAAGLIYSALQGRDGQDMVEFAAAASCLKHTIPGDFNMVSAEEVERLAGGDGSGRVRR